MKIVDYDISGVRPAVKFRFFKYGVHNWYRKNRKACLICIQAKMT